MCLFGLHTDRNKHKLFTSFTLHVVTTCFWINCVLSYKPCRWTNEQICLKMSSELWAFGFQIFCYVSRGFIWSLENSFYFGCYRISQMPELWPPMTFPHLFHEGLRCVFHLLDLSCLFRCPCSYLNKWCIYLYCVITYYLYLLPIFSYSKCSWSFLGSMTEMFTRQILPVLSQAD